jgi:hypothetical protein
MEFGIFTQFDLRNERSVNESITEWVNVALEADQMGVDCFWLGEFHFRKFTPLYELAELRSLVDEYQAARSTSRGHVTLQSTAYLAETGARARAEARESTLHERRISILQRSGRYRCDFAEHQPGWPDPARSGTQFHPTPDGTGRPGIQVSC